MRVNKGKIEISRSQYDTFLDKYKRHMFTGQKLGQAFYNHFDLKKVEDQAILKNIYCRNGKEALDTIEEIVEFVEGSLFEDDRRSRWLD